MNINSNDTTDLKITSFNQKEDLERKKEKYDYDLLKENKKKFYSSVEYKTQLLNIDSQYRDKVPKNIYSTDNKILNNNPISTLSGANIIQINYPNHSFSVGDNIIIQNVIGNYRVLTNSVYFFNNFPYMIINYNNHNIPLNFLDYYNDYQIKIEIISNLGSSTNYNNIPINLILGIFQCNLPSIVDKTISLLPNILELFNVKTASELDSNYILIKLLVVYILNNQFYNYQNF